jgi:hypothetical protein
VPCWISPKVVSTGFQCAGSPTTSRARTGSMRILRTAFQKNCQLRHPATATHKASSHSVVKVPGGLAPSEFRGYEEKVVAAILGIR